MSYFANAVAIIFGVEGYSSDDPQDPGGDTVYGISRAAHPTIPWPPTYAQAQQIYQDEYWTPNQCDSMPWAWSLAIFDAAVNAPSHLALAQQALGVEQDGVIGPETLAAIAKAPQDDWHMFIALRDVAYFNTPQDQPFDTGLAKRMSIISWNAALTPSSGLLGRIFS